MYREIKSGDKAMQETITINYEYATKYNLKNFGYYKTIEIKNEDGRIVYSKGCTHNRYHRTEQFAKNCKRVG
jgi:hypothetical protein